MSRSTVFDPKTFPPDFVWGAAAASYQIEGAARTDGKGLSVWDQMCLRPGAVFGGHTGDIACDHYHRWREDVDLMAQLGLKGYRLSIAWPRVLPSGTGPVNRRGLDFYDRLVDGLLARNIVPFVTLFHWDYPYDLYTRGGWLNPDSPAWFAEYTRVVVRKLSDRVRHWMTQNEPQCYIGLGHQAGIHAPGVKLGMPDLLLATHHSLLAHGRAVQAIRAASRTRALVGAAPVGVVRVPATSSARDIAAARHAMFSITDGNGFWNNTWFMDPILKGRYPEDGLKAYGAAVPRFSRKDLAVMHQPLDFFGVNVYHADIVRAGQRGAAVGVPLPTGHAQTANKWPMVPECLYWGPKFFQERYGLPIYVTENGLSSMDWIARDGGVHDPGRIDFLGRHLAALRRALADGVDLRGYFQWSILDNFEWAEGYKERFGLVYVDYPTQRRIPKDSYHWYRRVIATRGAIL